MIPYNQRCETCQYWITPTPGQFRLGLDFKDCRRRSALYGHAIPVAGWPQTRKDEWCGEWKMRGILP